MPTDLLALPRSEMGILTSTALLHRIVRQVTSDVLLQEMVVFILGEQREPETLSEISRYPLRHRLIEHCDHISDEVSQACERRPRACEMQVFIVLGILFCDGQGQVVVRFGWWHVRRGQRAARRSRLCVSWVELG